MARSLRLSDQGSQERDDSGNVGPGRGMKEFPHTVPAERQASEEIGQDDEPKTDIERFDGQAARQERVPTMKAAVMKSNTRSP